ncbi:MAG: hypothetical protein ACPLRW_05640 [Moorellales bacterium]
MGVTIWVSREVTNGDPVHETFEVARQAFVVGLAKRFGLKPERKEDCLPEFVDYGLRGSQAGQAASLIRVLAGYGLGRFVIDVPQDDPRAAEILQRAGEEAARRLCAAVSPHSGKGVAVRLTCAAAGNGDALHAAFEAARRAFVAGLARRFGLRSEDGLSFKAARAGEAARFLKELARRGLGGFAVSVPESDPRAAGIMQEASREAGEELSVEVCCI